MRVRGKTLEHELICAGLALAVFIVIWVMARRVERYRTRNAAGRCGHCPTALDGRQRQPSPIA